MLAVTRSGLQRGLIVYMWFNGGCCGAPAFPSDSHCSSENVYRTGSKVTPQIVYRTSSGFYERSENGPRTGEVSDGRPPGGFLPAPRRGVKSVPSVCSGVGR